MNKWLIDRQLVRDFLVLLFFFISGNPAFTQGLLGKYVNILMFLVILAIVHFKIPVKCWKEMLRWSFLLGMIFMFQFFLLGHITILGSANYVIKMMCAIMLAFTLGDSARDSALRVMTVLCLISLFFYSFNLFGIRFPSLVDIQSKASRLSYIRKLGMMKPVVYSGTVVHSGSLEHLQVILFLFYSCRLTR